MKPLFILSATPATCTGTCQETTWKGDNYCDDGNNNCGCEWDGGDCCGSNVKTDFCSACECLDPNAAGSRKKRNIETINYGNLVHLVTNFGFYSQLAILKIIELITICPGQNCLAI